MEFYHPDDAATNAIRAVKRYAAACPARDELVYHPRHPAGL